MKKSAVINLLCIILFISGASSLIYEIIWTRMLVLVFGNTAHSVIIVLSVFMAGLAFGSWWLGKKADKSSKLLLNYGLIELGIGLWALITPGLIKLITIFFSTQFIFIYDQSQQVFIKLIASFLILFPATTLMGATLPFVIKYFHCQGKKLSQTVGLLYGLNTLGAVFGTLISGFILIELFGLIGALRIGVLGNLSIAGLVLYLFSKDNTEKLLKIKLSSNSKKTKNAYSSTQIFILIFAFSLSGLIALAYEVILTRLITPSMGTFIYGFSASLAIYLFGLALGSFIYQKFLYIFSACSLVGWCLTLIGLLALLTQVFIAYFIPLWLPHPLIRMIAPIIVFLPLTIVLGIIFPAITQVFETESQVAGKVGIIYALNSLGSVFGSIVAGFLLIPILGSVGSIFLLGCVNALLGFLLLLAENRFDSFRLPGLLAATLVIAFCLLGLYQHQRWFIPRYIRVTLKHHFDRWSDTKYILKEDIVASVVGITASERKGRKLLIDGVGTTSLSEETKILAHLPLLIHPQPQDALVIALGMGTTFRSSLSYPQINIDVVELVPSVAQMMPLFHFDTPKVLSQNRGRIIINDGRNYVFMAPKKYDSVVIDPPPPDNAAGTTILFSQEFYQDIKKCLKPNGIVTGWFNYDLDIESYKMELRSFLNEFPYVLVFKSPRQIGLYLVGSINPINLNKEIINQRINLPTVRIDMQEWSGKIYDYNYLRSLYLGTEEFLNNFVKQTPPVTDYFPRSEYFLIRQLFKPQPIVSQGMIDSVFSQ